MGHITVCGLGPGGRGLINLETVELLATPMPRFLRTAIHPNADVAQTDESFDHLYESTPSFEELYARIADELVDAANRDGQVIYVVPGSPFVLERSVRHLEQRTDVELSVLPAMSFLDVAWQRLGIDPVDEAVSLVDALQFRRQMTGICGPVLIAHAYSKLVMSDLKLAVADVDLDAPAVVLQRLGTPEETVTEIEWHELDKVEADHLTSVFLPALAAPPGTSLARSVELMRELRERCPWDKEQTHASLVPYFAEEFDEVMAALGTVIDSGGSDASYGLLEEELGDLWFNILFQCLLAEEAGQFNMDTVASALHNKMVRRHPHVFDGASYDPTAWDRIKEAEPK